MKIINGSVYTEDYRFSPKDICIKGEYFDGITDRQKAGDKT
jgi:N-acetylglucosamine-6-phosphate deacetylase